MNKKMFKKEIRVLMKEIAGNKKSAASFVIAILAAVGSVSANLSQVSVENTSAAQTTNDMTFEVDVQDSLSVQITTPTTPATGDIDDFLRNTVSLDVSTNANNGFTASMYSKSSTDLEHTTLGSSYSIPTLAGEITRDDFVNGTNSAPDHWGYSLGEFTLDGASQSSLGDTSAGLATGRYEPMHTSNNPITIMNGATIAKKSGTRNVYFGTRVSSAKPSGTYSNTVVFSVVTGAIDAGTNPATPTNPVTPATDTVANDSAATYTGDARGVGISGTTGTTVYTTTSSTSTTETITTQVTGGDNRSSYASPQGVQSVTPAVATTTTNVNEDNTMLSSALAATAVVAGTSGAVFFLLAKKRDDDDDEEES
ncbi:hypothetical protein IKE99_02190 [Candidatus Saccharibacteria bacterium]|nr:hypothetical protein [Candidatus Saccharibacteria bacterium]